MNNVLYRAVEENLRAAMRCYARVNERGEARDYPGISVASCGLNCAVFNSALLNAPASTISLRRLLALADLHFRKRKLAWTFWLCDDLLDGAGRSIVCEAGLQMIAEPPGLYASRLSPPMRSHAPLSIRMVRNVPEMLDFAHLSSVIFNLPFQTSRSIYGAAELWRDPMRGWVGYLDDRAVSIATVVIAGDVAGVYSVGTLPEFQCRGFAETMMRHALAVVREEFGIEETVLQSTAQGLSLYTRLGYRPVTHFGVYLQENGF